MPKGSRFSGGREHRTQAEYESEIMDAIKRFRKYPERLRASSDVDDWKDFLVDIGISPFAINSGYSGYWEKIRVGTSSHSRISKYRVIKNVSGSSKIARRLRDWNADRAAQNLGYTDWEDLMSMYSEENNEE